MEGKYIPTGQEAEMFWIEVAALTIPDVEKVLERYTRGRHEDYKWEDARDPLEIRCRVISTKQHRSKILSALAKKDLLLLYEDYEHVR